MTMDERLPRPIVSLITFAATWHDLVESNRSTLAACARGRGLSNPPTDQRRTMIATSNPERLFTQRHRTYDRFIRAMLYPQGLRAFFEASPVLRANMRVLDAGCGTGALTFAVRGAMLHRGLAPMELHAFDLTPAMLDHFECTMQRRGIEEVTLAQANVLDLSVLPSGWTGYDLIVSASMLEYVLRERFVEALSGLRDRLAKDGTFVLFITRRTTINRLLIGHWWQSNLYSSSELDAAFRAAGFSEFTFKRFPLRAAYLSPWGHIVEGRR